MYTIERVEATFSVNQILEEMNTALSVMVGDDDDDVRELFDYRTSPGQIGMSITSTGDLPTANQWTDLHYDYLINITVPHNDTPETLRAAEYRLNDLVARVWNTLKTHQTDKWNDIEMPRKSLKPAAPSDNKFIRYAFVFIRIIPN